MGVTTVIKDYGTEILNAIRENDLQRLKLLLAKHLKSDNKIAQICVVDIKHRPTKKFACPLILAARQEDPRILRYMMEKGVDPNFVHHTIFSSKKREVVTALHIAVDLGLTDSVDVLLAANADANIGDHNHETPLHIAIKKADRVMTRMLLAKGADPAIVDRTGNAPLHTATLYGHLQMVRHLLKYNADVYQKGCWGAIPTHIAAREGHIHLIQLFCSLNMGNVNIKLPCYADRREKAPLHLAAENGHVETVLALLDQFEADCNLKDSDGNTPLHCVVLNPYDVGRMRDKQYFIQTARVLVKYRVSVNDKNDFGDTALHLAAMNHYQKIVELLLDIGANPMVENEEHLKPLDVVPDDDPVTKQLLKAAMLQPRQALNMSIDILPKDSFESNPMMPPLMGHRDRIADAGQPSMSQSMPENTIDPMDQHRMDHQHFNNQSTNQHQMDRQRMDPTQMDHQRMERPDQHMNQQHMEKPFQQSRRHERTPSMNSTSTLGSVFDDVRGQQIPLPPRPGNRDREQQRDHRGRENEISTYSDMTRHGDRRRHDDLKTKAKMSMMSDASLQRPAKPTYQAEVDDDMEDTCSVSTFRDDQSEASTYVSAKPLPAKRGKSKKDRYQQRIPSYDDQDDDDDDDDSYYEDTRHGRHGGKKQYDDDGHRDRSNNKRTKTKPRDGKSGRSADSHRDKRAIYENVGDANNTTMMPYMGDEEAEKDHDIKVHTIPGKPGAIEVQYRGGPITISVDPQSMNGDNQTMPVDGQPGYPPVTQSNAYNQYGQNDDQYTGYIPSPAATQQTKEVSQMTPENLAYYHGQGISLQQLQTLLQHHKGKVVMVGPDEQSRSQGAHLEELPIDDSENVSAIVNGSMDFEMDVTQQSGMSGLDTPQQSAVKAAISQKVKEVTSHQYEDYMTTSTPTDTQNQDLFYQQNISEENTPKGTPTKRKKKKKAKERNTPSVNDLEEEEQNTEYQMEDEQIEEQYTEQDDDKKPDESFDMLRKGKGYVPKKAVLPPSPKKNKMPPKDVEDEVNRIQDDAMQETITVTTTEEILNNEKKTAKPKKKPRTKPVAAIHIATSHEITTQQDDKISPDLSPNKSPQYKSFAQKLAWAEGNKDTKPKSDGKVKSVKPPPGAIPTALITTETVMSNVKKPVEQVATSQQQRNSPMHSSYSTSADINKSVDSEEWDDSEFDDESSDDEEIQGKQQSPKQYYSITPAVDLDTSSGSGGQSTIVTRDMKESKHHNVTTAVAETVVVKQINGGNNVERFETEHLDVKQTYGEDMSASNRGSSPVNYKDIQKLKVPSSGRYSPSTGSTTSEGSIRRYGLNMRVTHDMPKAYSRQEKTKSRTEFIKTRPAGIESSSETSDSEMYMSKSSLAGSRNSIIDSRSDLALRKNEPESRQDPKSPEKPVPAKRIMGGYVKPYKTFGKIDVKTDALEDATIEVIEDDSDEEGPIGGQKLNRMSSFSADASTDVNVTPDSPKMRRANRPDNLLDTQNRTSDGQKYTTILQSPTKVGSQFFDRQQQHNKPVLVKTLPPLVPTTEPQPVVTQHTGDVSANESFYTDDFTEDSFSDDQQLEDYNAEPRAFGSRSRTNEQSLALAEIEEPKKKTKKAKKKKKSTNKEIPVAMESAQQPPPGPASMTALARKGQLPLATVQGIQEDLKEQHRQSFETIHDYENTDPNIRVAEYNDANSRKMSEESSLSVKEDMTREDNEVALFSAAAVVRQSGRKKKKSKEKSKKKETPTVDIQQQAMQENNNIEEAKMMLESNYTNTDVLRAASVEPIASQKDASTLSVEQVGYTVTISGNTNVTTNLDSATEGIPPNQDKVSKKKKKVRKKSHENYDNGSIQSIDMINDDNVKKGKVKKKSKKKQNQQVDDSYSVQSMDMTADEDVKSESVIAGQNEEYKTDDNLSVMSMDMIGYDDEKRGKKKKKKKKEDQKTDDDISVCSIDMVGDDKVRKKGKKKKKKHGMSETTAISTEDIITTMTEDSKVTHVRYNIQSPHDTDIVHSQQHNVNKLPQESDRFTETFQDTALVTNIDDLDEEPHARRNVGTIAIQSSHHSTKETDIDADIDEDAYRHKDIVAPPCKPYRAPSLETNLDDLVEYEPQGSTVHPAMLNLARVDKVTKSRGSETSSSSSRSSSTNDTSQQYDQNKSIEMDEPSPKDNGFNTWQSQESLGDYSRDESMDREFGSGDFQRGQPMRRTQRSGRKQARRQRKVDKVAKIEARESNRQQRDDTIKVAEPATTFQDAAFLALTGQYSPVSPVKPKDSEEPRPNVYTFQDDKAVTNSYSNAGNNQTINNNVPLNSESTYQQTYQANTRPPPRVPNKPAHQAGSISLHRPGEALPNEQDDDLSKLSRSWKDQQEQDQEIQQMLMSMRSNSELSLRENQSEYAAYANDTEPLPEDFDAELIFEATEFTGEHTSGSAADVAPQRGRRIRTKGTPAQQETEDFENPPELPRNPPPPVAPKPAHLRKPEVPKKPSSLAITSKTTEVTNTAETWARQHGKAEVVDMEQNDQQKRRVRTKRSAQGLLPNFFY